MTEDEHNDLHEQAQDVALSATVLTSLYQELSSSEWDEFVAQVGREVYELLVQRMSEKADELEAKAVSGGEM